MKHIIDQPHAYQACALRNAVFVALKNYNNNIIIASILDTLEFYLTSLTLE